VSVPPGGTSEQDGADEPDAAPPPEGPSPDDQDPQEPGKEIESYAEEVVAEVLEGLPVDPETREQITERFEIFIASVRSPLPPPGVMREYEEILPGAAERLFAMIEKQTDHRHDVEDKIIDVQVQTIVSGNRKSGVGQILGFIIAIVFFIGSCKLVLDGHALEGTTLGTLDLIGLVSVFVLGEYRRVGNDEPEDD
jgi:uncharacterized membrane protein